MRSYFVPCQAPGGKHRVHVTEWGDEHNPNVLICVHGLTRCGRDFDVLAEALADRYRIVCPDIAGRGDSDWLRRSEDYNYPQYASDMVRVIAKTHAKSVHWFGTSMGAIIGMVLAAQPHTPITRMVVNDIGSRIPAAALQRIGMYVGVSPLFHTIDEVVQAVRVVSPFGPLTDHQWVALTLPLMKKTANGMWQFRYDPAIGDVFKGAPMGDVDLSEYWDAIRCPVLITRGAESDLLLKSTFDEMCAKPNVRGVTFADTGHAPIFQSEQTIAPVRAFLLGD